MEVRYIVENIFTMAFMVGGVLGVYYMTETFHGFWFLLLLMNLNNPVSKEPANKE